VSSCPSSDETRAAGLFSLVSLDAAADCFDYQLFVKQDVPVACTPHRCIELTVVPPAAKPVERTLPPVATWTRATRKACHGTTCRALEPRFTAELVRRSKLLSVRRHHELEISFTTDHRIGVVTGPLPHRALVPADIDDAPRGLRWRLGCVDHEPGDAVVTFATAAVGRPVAPRGTWPTACGRRPSVTCFATRRERPTADRGRAAGSTSRAFPAAHARPPRGPAFVPADSLRLRAIARDDPVPSALTHCGDPVVDDPSPL
jgi:hypothetical protein